MSRYIMLGSVRGEKGGDRIQHDANIESDEGIREELNR
jgi:hypothetical protein